MFKTVIPSGPMETRNESEKIFEQYLNTNGYEGKWTYEPVIQGKSKKPDYMLKFNNENHFFEVKELRKKQDEPSFPAHINPYKRLQTACKGIRLSRSELYQGKRSFSLL